GGESGKSKPRPSAGRARCGSPAWGTRYASVSLMASGEDSARRSAERSWRSTTDGSRVCQRYGGGEPTSRLSYVRRRPGPCPSAHRACDPPAVCRAGGLGLGDPDRRPARGVVGAPEAAKQPPAIAPPGSRGAPSDAIALPLSLRRYNHSHTRTSYSWCEIPVLPRMLLLGSRRVKGVTSGAA